MRIMEDDVKFHFNGGVTNTQFVVVFALMRIHGFTTKDTKVGTKNTGSSSMSFSDHPWIYHKGHKDWHKEHGTVTRTDAEL
jgi:hypothetical protein